MSNEISDFREYLTLKLADYQKTPQLCSHSISAYQMYINWLDQSQNGDDFHEKIRQDGHMFSAAKAEELDKRQALLTLQQKFQHEKATLAAELRLKAVQAAQNFVDFNRIINAQVETAAQLDTLENDVQHAVLEFITVILAYINKNSKDKEAYGQNVVLAYQKIKALDENFNFTKLKNHPPYRRRIIFDDVRLDKLLQVCRTWGLS